MSKTQNSHADISFQELKIHGKSNYNARLPINPMSFIITTKR